MNCIHCGKDVIYKCGSCGRQMCRDHLRLRAICPSCHRKTATKYSIQKMASDKEREKIRELVQHFWGEQEQLTFDREFSVAGLPAYGAKVKKSMIAFVSYTEAEEAILIVALGVLPEYQNSGIGSSLIEKVTTEAKKMGKKRLLVSTSNDNLPALAFYQTLGFQLYEVKPNAIAEKHGEVLKGIGGLPIRDELRFQKRL